MLDSLYGFKIVESNLLTERKQWRFPRSKKRRIQKKWSKDERNVRYEPKAYQSGQTIYCHPQITAKLREEFGKKTIF